MKQNHCRLELKQPQYDKLRVTGIFKTKQLGLSGHVDVVHFPGLDWQIQWQVKKDWSSASKDH